jgi:hypothetical protein
MCGVSEATIRNRCSEPIVKNDPKCDVLQAQTGATRGGKQSQLHGSRTIAILLKEFNPARLGLFLEFGIDEGLAQMVGVPLPAPPATKMPRTELELATKYVELLQAKTQTELYLENKPGLAHKVAQAHQPDKALSAENLSFDEMCDLRGFRRLEIGAKRELSRKMANAVSNDLLARVETKTVSVPGKKKPQYYQVKAYPLECLATFDNVMAIHGGL